MIKIQEFLFEEMRIMRGQMNKHFKASRHVLVANNACSENGLDLQTQA